MIDVNLFVLSGSVLVVYATDTLHVNVNDECDVLRATDSTQRFSIMTIGSRSKRIKVLRQCTLYTMTVQLDPTSRLLAQFNFKTLIKESDLQIRDLSRLQSLQLQ